MCRPDTEEQLADLRANSEINCGESLYMAASCDDVAAVQQQVDCMNLALDRGATAKVYTGMMTSSGFEKDVWRFTAGNRIRIFVDYPGGTGDRDAYAEELPACTGPFHLDQLTCPFGGGIAPVFVVDGCPP